MRCGESQELPPRFPWRACPAIALAKVDQDEIRYGKTSLVRKKKPLPPTFIKEIKEEERAALVAARGFLGQ